jgi:hypothetical protein
MLPCLTELRRYDKDGFQVDSQGNLDPYTLSQNPWPSPFMKQNEHRD